MSVEIRIETHVPGIEGLVDFDPSPALRRMEAYFLREFGDMFESQGSSRSHPWAPLSPTYAMAKAAAGKSPKILHLNGILRASAVTLERGPDYVDIGFRDRKAPWHDKGRGNNPERPLIRPIPRDFETLAKHLEAEVHRQGVAG